MAKASNPGVALKAIKFNSRWLKGMVRVTTLFTAVLVPKVAASSKSQYSDQHFWGLT